MLRLQTVLAAALLAGAASAQSLSVDDGLFLHRLSLEADEHFAFDSADLTSEGVDALSGLLAAIARVKAPKLLVTGHADRLGSDAYNLELSLKRAEAVAKYLRNEGGLPAGAIGVAALGEARPIVACKTETGDALKACLAPNRRVEVVFASDALVEREGVALMRELDGAADLIEVEKIDRTSVTIVE